MAKRKSMDAHIWASLLGIKLYPKAEAMKLYYTVEASNAWGNLMFVMDDKGRTSLQRTDAKQFPTFHAAKQICDKLNALYSNSDPYQVEVY